MSKDILIKAIDESRADEIGQVFFDAIHDGAPAYTPEQRAAWAPVPRSGSEWRERLARQRLWGAFSGDQLIGFMSLEDDAYVDFAYILSAYQGLGIFPRLFAEVESSALVAGTKLLRTHASLMARRAFEKVGFTVTHPETVEINGIALKRFEMAKVIAG